MDRYRWRPRRARRCAVSASARLSNTKTSHLRDGVQSTSVYNAHVKGTIIIRMFFFCLFLSEEGFQLGFFFSVTSFNFLPQCNNIVIIIIFAQAFLFDARHVSPPLIMETVASLRSDSGHPMQGVRRPQLRETLRCLRLRRLLGILQKEHPQEPNIRL